MRLIIGIILITAPLLGSSGLRAEGVDRAEARRFLDELHAKQAAEKYDDFLWDIESKIEVIRENLVVRNIVEFRAIALLTACQIDQKEVISKIMGAIEIDSAIADQFPGGEDKVVQFRQSVRAATLSRLRKLRQGAAILSGMLADQHKAELCTAGKELALDIISKG